MSFLLDTNVVSEWVKARPNAGVVTWLAEADKVASFLFSFAIVTLTGLASAV